MRVVFFSINCSPVLLNKLILNGGDGEEIVFLDHVAANSRILNRVTLNLSSFAPVAARNTLTLFQIKI